MLYGTESLNRQDQKQLLKTVITYIHCGIDGWRYCFNVLDVFAIQWVAYVFNTISTTHTAIQSIFKAISLVGGVVSGLILRTDNSSQYSGREFRASMQTLGIRHEFIWKNTPEQNGHVESSQSPQTRICLAA